MDARTPRTAPKRRLLWGLSGRLLVLTTLFVMLAEVLIYIPSIANFRNTWLQDKLGAARIAAMVIEATPDETLPEALTRDVLDSIGARAIALRIKGTRRLIASDDMPPMVSAQYDLRQPDRLMAVVESFDTLVFGGDRMIRVVGHAAMGGDFVEVVLPDAPLREAMIRFSINILLLSLFISAITASLVFLTLRAQIVRPVQQLTRQLAEFAEHPEDQTSRGRPSTRQDEIGEAEVAMERMRAIVSRHLQQKERLAQLGLAVAKINHDLRNMLASAQLISDRLAEIRDPSAQRFVPKLITALDRAIAFAESTLTYGKASERAPVLRALHLRAQVEEVAHTIGLDSHATVRWENRVPESLEVAADPEHLFRILANLLRNAVQALEGAAREGSLEPLCITVSAAATGGQHCIDICDNGPGVPGPVRQRLFEAFTGSQRPGGTGLGLAIASDLVRAQGGTLTLLDSQTGAHFRIALPARI
jgi:signal transduction histidine kinase